MAYKDKEKNKEYNRLWYLRTRKNNSDFKVWKKEYDKEYHKEYKNPNLTPEKSKEYQEKYRIKHLEEIRERQRNYKKQKYHEKYKEQNKQYRLENKEKIKRYAKKYKEEGRNRLYRLKHRYNLTPDEYKRIKESQNNICPICLENFDTRKEYVDHDHKTGKIRGIIHRECNSLLGFAKDDTKILENAIKYIKEKGNEQTTTISTS